MAVGRIVRPHGVSGTVKAVSYSGSGEAFVSNRKIYIRGESGDIMEHELLDVRPHKNVFLLILDGVTTLEDGEAYRNAEILVSKQLLERRHGEFFWFELIGLDVFLEDGGLLGSISEIIPTGSNDIYVVRGTEGKKTLVPATHEVVLDIDLDKGRMVIAPLEGLLELNED